VYVALLASERNKPYGHQPAPSAEHHRDEIPTQSNDLRAVESRKAGKHKANVVELLSCYSGTTILD